MKMNHSAGIAPIASALALLLGSGGVAQADLLATSVVAVTNAQIVIAGTNTALTGYRTGETAPDGAQWEITGGGNAGNVDANLDSVAGGPVSAARGPINIFPFNLPQVKEGAAPVAADNFVGLTNPLSPQQTVEPSATNPLNPTATGLVNAGVTPGGVDVVASGNFAMADQLLQGAVVNLPTLGIVAGANAYVRADSYLNRNDVGDANANVNANVTFNFIPTADLTIELLADFGANSEAWASADSLPGSTATATYSFNFRIRDVESSTTLVSWSPFTASSTSANNAALGPDTFDYYSTSVRSPTVTLVAGRNYNFVIDASTGVDTSLVVPEPASIAILGTGLGLLGAFSRRRRSEHRARD